MISFLQLKLLVGIAIVVFRLQCLNVGVADSYLNSVQRVQLSFYVRASRFINSNYYYLAVYLTRYVVRMSGVVRISGVVRLAYRRCMDSRQKLRITA